VDVYLPAQIENQMQFGCFIGERPRLMFPAINHEAGYHRRCKKEKKKNHHGTAARAMPKIPLGTKQDEISYIAERRGGLVDKV
jgi:hypothetical protein